MLPRQIPKIENVLLGDYCPKIGSRLIISNYTPGKPLSILPKNVRCEYAYTKNGIDTLCSIDHKSCHPAETARTHIANLTPPERNSPPRS